MSLAPAPSHWPSRTIMLYPSELKSWPPENVCGHQRQIVWIDWDSMIILQHNTNQSFSIYIFIFQRIRNGEKGKKAGWWEGDGPYIVAPIDSWRVNAGDLWAIGWTSSTDKVSSIGSAIIDECDGLLDVSGRGINPIPVLAGDAVLDAEETEISTSRVQSDITLDGESNISLASIDARSSQFLWCESVYLVRVEEKGRGMV